MDELFTAEQAAAILQLSPKTIKDWLRAGKLTGCKIGRVWRVTEADLKAFIWGARMSHEREDKPRHDFVDLNADERDLFELGYATHRNRGAGLYWGL